MTDQFKIQSQMFVHWRGVHPTTDRSRVLFANKKSSNILMIHKVVLFYWRHSFLRDLKMVP